MRFFDTPMLAGPTRVSRCESSTSGGESGRRGRAAATAFVALTALGSGARAQSPASDSTAHKALSGTVTYTSAAVNNLVGGARRGTVVAGAAAAQLTVGLRELVGWRGAHAFVSVLATHGGAPSDIVGDVQGVSNLEAPAGVRLEEAWLQQNALADRLSLLAGRYDLSTEFYFTRSGNLFLNSSPGMGAEFGSSGVESLGFDWEAKVNRKDPIPPSRSRSSPPRATSPSRCYGARFAIFTMSAATSLGLDS
jgi:hypothetical protein